jgi:glycosyltransferase involved in cell wall biosynthesis
VTSVRSADGRTDTLDPLVSVVVPCRNERAYIAECLDSILANDYAAERVELIVVDGASDDGTRAVLEEYARRWPRIQWFDNPARTTPAALNIGIRRARGDIIMRMDAHCRYSDSYISRLVSWLEQSGADNVGGVCRTLPGADTVIARAIAATLAHPFGVGDSHFRIGTPTAKWVDTVPFGCYRRSVFERIGFFDEELVRNQDDELNQRLLKSGGRILLVPDVVSEYYARDSLSKVARMYYQYGYFKPLVARKLGRVGTVRQLVPAAFLVSLAVTLLLSPWLIVSRWAFAGIFGAYVIVLFLAMLQNSIRNGLGVSALLAATFPVIHFSYAAGSLRGIMDFVLLRRSAVTSRSAIPVSR